MVRSACGICAIYLYENLEVYENLEGTQQVGLRSFCEITEYPVAAVHCVFILKVLACLQTQLAIAVQPGGFG